MRLASNSLACATAKFRAFSLAGISEAKRMVEGLLHPGLIAVAMGYLLELCMHCCCRRSTGFRCPAAHGHVIQNTGLVCRDPNYTTVGRTAFTLNWSGHRQIGSPMNAI